MTAADQIVQNIKKVLAIGAVHIWQCGVAAIAWLTTATLNKWVSCNALREKDGRRIARCSSSEHADLAGDMIKEGLAVCLPDSEDQRVRSYSQDQEQARKAYKGLWSSQFAMPWDYRAKQASSRKNDHSAPTVFVLAFA